MSYQLKEILQNNYFLLIVASVISVIIRIPFLNLAPTGKDAFTMYWIGSLVLQGKLGTWELNILSLFGMYPFSGYPVGGDILIAILEYIFQNITLTFFVYSSLCAVIAVLLSYKVFRNFTGSSKLAIIGALIYSTFPDFVLYTYLSASIRGFFIALLPGFYLLCIRFYNKPNLKNFGLVIGGVIFLSLFHRTGNVLLAWVVILVLLVVFQKIDIKKRYEKHLKLLDKSEKIFFAILTVLAFLFMFLSSYIIKPNPIELANPWFGFKPGINAFMSVFIDICLRIGPAIFIAFLGISQFLYSKWTNKNLANKYSTLNFILLFVLSPFFTESLYLTLLIALPLNIFSVQFLNTILKENNYGVQKIKYWIIGIFFILFNIFYYVFYDLFVIPVGIIVLLFLGLAILFCITVLYSKININVITTKEFKRIFFVLLVLSIVLFSTFQMSAVFKRNDTFPYDYLSNQEVKMANELKDLNKQAPVGRLLISDSSLAVHIMALTGYLSFYDPYFMSYLVDGAVNASQIENNSQLRPILHWYYNYIYSTNYSALPFDPNNINDQLFNSNMTTAIPYFIEFHTRYVITLHSTVVTTDWATYNSTLIQDLLIHQDSTLVYTTKDLYLWKLTY